MKPEFVDNRDGNLLVSALRGHLDWLAKTYAEPVQVSIATGYFNPEGFALIVEALKKTAGVRLLLGAEPTVPPVIPRRKPGDKRGRAYTTERVQAALQASEMGLSEDRDILGFSSEVDSKIQSLLDFIASGKIEVRRYEKAFLHGKAFIFNSEEGVIAGSSNFTAAGLTSNMELNLGHYQPSVVKQVKGWFDELWEQSVPFDLAAIYAARYLEYTPYWIYLRVLYELYGQEIEEEQPTNTRIRLTGFQTDGIYRAGRILDRYNGVIVADGVGLGKTFIGGELLRQAVEDRRQRALLVAPAALRDGTWERFKDQHQLYLEKISYEQLAAEVQLGGDQAYLKDDAKQYAMVIVDEAHAFRNPDARRSQALRRLLQGTPPKKLVLMTATPVNNSLWDLYYMLTYFIGHDAAFAEIGIRSLKERFQQAVSEDPYTLRPDMLFDILDATTVRRTRHFVQRYYPNDQVMGPDGIPVTIRFPTSHVARVDYRLDDSLPGFFEEFANALAPQDDEPVLTLARYWPSRYQMIAPPEIQQREAALTGLLRSGLLKRFESSIYAFAETASRMADSHDAFLDALSLGYIPTPEAIGDWEETDSDEAFETLLKESGSSDIRGYDIGALRHDVEKDRDLLRHFASRARQIHRVDDPKLIRLADILAQIAGQAENEGIGEADVRNKRKVLIFTYFADTVSWIEEYVLWAVENDPRLVAYQGRVASVNAINSKLNISREDAVFGFAPISTQAPVGRDEDRFDILLTTDVLAEGQNLQQCRNIINYDLPWNPMRLVQRNGRIDRIGSPHRDVFIHCFFPDIQLDELLALEARIRVKLAQAAASIGVESEVIPDGTVSENVFTETRDQIEALRREDAELFRNGGEEPNAHSGEEYRQELRRGLSLHQTEIKALPWAAGSGFAQGQVKGHFFCARVGEHVFLRFVPFDKSDLIRDRLGCLKLIACSETTDRHMPQDLREQVYNAWATAQTDIYEEWTFATDPANLQPKVRPLFRETANHLRTYPPANLTQGELDTILNALEAPWGVRIERQIREVFNREGDPFQVSEAIVAQVRELGLQPFVPPEALPVIDSNEVQLICWMAVEGP